MASASSSSSSTIIFFFISCALCMLISSTPLTAATPFNRSLIAGHGISAVYAFGDSTLDPGNNDYLATAMKGDHAPYGRDFPGRIATGRFSNGMLMTDFLVSKLGLKHLLPAYSDPRVTDQELLTGASFASSGSGLDDLTAHTFNVLPLSAQLRNFKTALGRMQRAVGSERASQIVENAVFVIGAGTNDLLWNFYDMPTRKAQFITASSYQNYLLGRLQFVVQRLHNMGARKFALSGLPPIGCLPVQVTIGSLIPGKNMFRRLCVEQENNDSQSYNFKLQGLISRLQTKLPGSRISYVDIYNPLMDMINNPGRYGFQETLVGCCGTGMLEMGGMCSRVVPTCPDPSKYLFWDAVHPTQAAYQILANIYSSTVLPQLG